MGSQINILKKQTHSTPADGMKGIGFDVNGNLVVINENGTATIVGAGQSVIPIIANRGVDIIDNLPTEFSSGDIYVTSDFFKKYESLDGLSWVITDLQENQFITDSSSDPVLLYQYNGTQLLTIKPILFDDDINLSNQSVKTPSGAATTQSLANVEYTDTLKAITAQLARISSASLTFQPESVPVLISNVESIFDIKTELASSNTDILEIDDLNNTITLKVAGRYQFLTTAVVENISLSADRIIYFRTRDLSDDTIITERQTTIQKNSITPLTKLTTFDVIESQLPLTIYPTVTASAAGNLYVNDLSSQVTIGGIAASTTDKYVAISENDTTPGYLNDKFLVGGEFNKTTQNPSAIENLLLTFKGWIYNAGRTFKHILQSNATADRTIALPDSSGDLSVNISEIKSTFDSTTAAADPGAGFFRFNVDKSEMYINYIQNQGCNIKSFLSDGIKLKYQSGGNKYVAAKDITITDNGTWATISQTVDNQGDSFSDGDLVGLLIVGGDVDGTVATGDFVFKFDSTDAVLPTFPDPGAFRLVGGTTLSFSTQALPEPNESSSFDNVNLNTYLSKIMNGTTGLILKFVSVDLPEDYFFLELASLDSSSDLGGNKIDTAYAAVYPSSLTPPANNSFWYVTPQLISKENSYDLGFAMSDETSDLTTDNDGEIEIIRNQVIQSITFSVNTAPTGSGILVNVLKNGVTILTGNISLPVSTKTITITPPQISTTNLVVGDRIKVDITQIGATIPGAGAKIYVKTIL